MIAKRADKKWFSVLKKILYIASLLMPIYYIIKYTVGIEVHEINISYRPCLFSLALIILAFLIRLWTWNYLTLQFGVKISLLDSGKSYFMSQLAKYVPGKVGIFVIRMQAYRAFPPRTVITSMFIEYIIGIMAACQIVLLSLIFTNLVLPSYIRILALVCFGVLLLVLYPSIFSFLLDRIMRVFKRDQIRPIPSFPTIINSLFLFFASNILNGIAFFIMFKSMNNSVLIGDLPLIVGVYYGASLAGLVAFFAPAGLGVREGVLFLVLPLLFASNNTEVILSALIMRILIILSEYLLMGVFTSLKNRSKTKQ